METRDLIILIVVIVYASVRIYMKYGRKKAGTRSSGKDSMPDLRSDYEPYSGKNT